MIDLEHLQVLVRIAQREGVQASAQYHSLEGATGHGSGQGILGKAAAGCHKQSGRRPTGNGGQGGDDRVGVRPQDWVSERIDEYGGAVEVLMSGAISRGAKRSAAGFSFFHEGTFLVVVFTAKIRLDVTLAGLEDTITSA